MSVLKIQRKKSKRKNNALKKERQILREIADNKRAERLEKNEKRKKADAEIMVFENAVISKIYDLLCEKKKFNKTEKRFVGVMLQDMASNISLPIYRAMIYETEENSLKNVLISASVNVKNIINILGDSFGFEVSKDMENDAVRFVCSAMRHLKKCLEHGKFNFTKRENEYASLMLKKEGNK
jgi:predicted double-glycine peptidase